MCVRVFLGTYGTEHKRQDLGVGGSDDKGCPMNKMQQTHPQYGDTQTAGMVVFEGLVPALLHLSQLLASDSPCMVHPALLEGNKPRVQSESADSVRTNHRAGCNALNHLKMSR